MSSEILLEVGFILLLVFANGIFAMSEIAVVSSRKSRLRDREKRGDHGAAVALSLIEQPNRFLSTVQVGITIIGVGAGAFGGAALVDPLSTGIESIAPLAPYSATLSLVLVVAFISFLSLVLGELVPKRVALSDPEAVASRIAPLMSLLSRIALPAVRILSWSTDGVLRALRIRARIEPPVTEEEISDMVEQGAQAGVFQPQEQEMVERVFEFADLRARSLMTPRTDVDWLDLTESPESILREISQSGHSRFPVAEEDLDRIVGVLNARDLIAATQCGKRLDIRAYLHQPLYIPQHAPSRQVLELFRKEPVHFALVIDEYGGFQGVITPYDILKSLVGGLPPEAGEPRPSMTRREDGSWLVDALVPIPEFKELFDIDELPGERDRFGTVGGFVIDILGHMPKTGERTTWGEFGFEIVDMDGPRIDKILVKKESMHVEQIK